jgi:hypothetical protein
MADELDYIGFHTMNVFAEYPASLGGNGSFHFMKRIFHISPFIDMLASTSLRTALVIPPGQQSP